MKYIFWISLVIILYPYVGYPLILWIKNLFNVNKINRMTPSLKDYPFVSVVIAVKNEELNIEKKIRNILDQTYPENSFEMIIIADGSSDDTNDIIERLSLEINSKYNFFKIKIISYFPSHGKAFALNQGVNNASGELIIFSDARQIFEANAIEMLVLTLQNQQIGCVSGELLFEGKAGGDSKPEMGIYWQYEKWIRKQESFSGFMVGATGAIYAIRKSLFYPIPSNTILDDVLIPISIIFKGFYAVFNDQARAYDKPTGHVKDEWRRKVRTLAGNWQLLSINNDLILPWRNPIWFRFISHKILRLIVPFFLPVFFISCLFIQEPLYRFFAISQFIFYGIVGLAYIRPSIRNIRIVNISFFFVTLNLAAITGFYYYVTDRTDRLW